jgi:hypothetical protein
MKAAVRSSFFCSGVMLLMILMYQNLLGLLSFDTLILERVLGHSPCVTATIF